MWDKIDDRKTIDRAIKIFTLKGRKMEKGWSLNLRLILEQVIKYRLYPSLLLKHLKKIA